jgi:hypothetical protein
MPESKSGALPLGYAPIFQRVRSCDVRRFCRMPTNSPTKPSLPIEPWCLPHPAAPRRGLAGATRFCKAGDVVWFNPDSKIYFAPGSQFCGNTKSGCKAFADKEGCRATKGN